MKMEIKNEQYWKKRSGNYRRLYSEAVALLVLNGIFNSDQVAKQALNQTLIRRKNTNGK